MTHQVYEQLSRFSLQRSFSRRTGNRFYRKLVLPERLESRNAPGVMLPFLPQLDSLEEEMSSYTKVGEHRSRYHSTQHPSSDSSSTINKFSMSVLPPNVVDDVFADLGEIEYGEFNTRDELASMRAQTNQFWQLPTSDGMSKARAISNSDSSSQIAHRIGMLLDSLLDDSVIDSRPNDEIRHDPERPLDIPARLDSTSSVSGDEAVAHATGGEGGGTGGHAPVSIPSTSESQTTAPAPIIRQDFLGPASATPDENVQDMVGIPSGSAHAETASLLIATHEEPVVENREAPVVANANPAGSPEPNSYTENNRSAKVVPAVESQTNTTLVSTTESTSTAAAGYVITAAEVEQLLKRASGATASDNAIIAVVDRQGNILGVRVEDGVPIDPVADSDTLVFAIDGAVAKARTAAFFSNDQAALTSRTVRFISQSTITQREVQANPNSSDQEIRGPGFVAPIGLGGHFPPEVFNTPHVDLFAIEHTNRDSVVNPGVDRVRQTATVDGSGTVTGKSGDDILLGTRFGATFESGQEINAPESYGLVSGKLTEAQSRGIATLPGGIPLYRNGTELVGGIGVFFPGTDGYADFEQGYIPGVGQSTAQRVNAPLVLEAEYIAAAAVGLVGGTIDGIPTLTSIGTKVGRIDLVGITLEGLGPHPSGPQTVFQRGADVGPGIVNGIDVPVIADGTLFLSGEAIPSGWLVMPTASADLTASEVEGIILRGVEEALLVRSAIRLPLGSRSRMVLSVTDKDGKVLGLFRMDDSTFFSIDVAVAKARNVAYYADSTPGTGIESVDLVDGDGDGIADVSPGVALTNRTFRYLSEPRFPSGIEETRPGPFSTLFTPGVNPSNAENKAGVIPMASDFNTVLGFDAFNPASNFHEEVPATGFQNGVVFFPGSTPLYKNGVLVGGFGVSGDGVDQDDVVTFVGAGSFLPRRGSGVTRADEVFVRDVRLPFQKFLRNPHG